MSLGRDLLHQQREGDASLITPLRIYCCNLYILIIHILDFSLRLLTHSSLVIIRYGVSTVAGNSIGEINIILLKASSIIKINGPLERLL